MGEVVDINAKQPHLSGKVLCLNCKHVWTGVSPVGMIHQLECPACGMMKGVFSNIVFPVGEHVLTCECDNYHFVVRVDNSKMCSLCGKVHV